MSLPVLCLSSLAEAAQDLQHDIPTHSIVLTRKRSAAMAPATKTADIPYNHQDTNTTTGSGFNLCCCIPDVRDSGAGHFL